MQLRMLQNGFPIEEAFLYGQILMRIEWALKQELVRPRADQ